MQSEAKTVWESMIVSDEAPICAFDTEFRLTAFNRAHNDEFERVNGFRTQVGDVFPDLFVAEQRPVMRALMARALAGESFTIVEEFGKPELGKPQWAIRYTPLRDASGTIIGAFHRAEDVSARFVAEDELRDARDRLHEARASEAAALALAEARAQVDAAVRESEGRFRAMADSSPVIMWVTDASGYCTHLNRRWYAYTGQAERAGEGYGWLEAVHPDDRATAEDVFVAANAERRDYRVEFRVRRADGAYRWAIDAAAARFDLDGSYLGYVGSVTDIDEQREREEALRVSTARAQALAAEQSAILGQLAEGVVVTDPAGRITFFNEAATRIHGVGRLDIEPDDYSDGYHLRTTEGLPYPADELPLVRAVRDRETVQDVRWRIHRPDGAEVQAIGAARPVLADDGTLLGAVLTLRDDTERSRAEAALRASEEFNRRILESSADCIKVLDLDGNVEFMSEGALCALEIDDFDSVAGRCWPDFWQGAEHGWAAAAVDTARRGGTGRLQGSAPTMKGNPRWWDVIVTPIAGPNGKPERLLSISRDVTATKLAESALRDLNEELEQRVAERTQERDRLWHNSQDLQVVIDHQGTFQAVSPAVTAILGWAPDDLVGKTVFDFVVPDDQQSSQGALDHARRDPLPTFENRYQHKDGGERWLSWVAAPQGDLVYASGRHITAEKHRELELQQAQEALRQSQKMEAVGQLTGGIAHDFNNMLAVVIGSLDLLGRRLGDGDARAKRYVDAAADGARRAALLTQRLLAFSRQQPLRPEQVDVNTLVTGMSTLIRGSLGSDIRFETVLAGGGWRAHVDPNQLENVLLNLAVNARDAMPDGGRLTVETQNAHLDDRYAAAHLGVPAGQYVLIAVSDTGCGMPPADIAKAFDPFFTTKDVGKGTGLGLSQVYGFVKQSGGHVKIYSEPGQGTVVKVYLPRMTGADDEIAVDPAAPDMPLGEQDEVVLVVEDEPAVRQFSVDALTELGYRVLESDGAANALRLLDAHPEIALMFTDIVMPDVNGAKLAEEARRRRPELKILFTTGYTRNAIVHNGVLDPGVELVGKPFTIEELAAKVRTVLDS